jgi:hypothetical protein
MYKQLLSSKWAGWASTRRSTYHVVFDQCWVGISQFSVTYVRLTSHGEFMSPCCCLTHVGVLKACIPPYIESTHEFSFHSQSFTIQSKDDISNMLLMLYDDIVLGLLSHNNSDVKNTSPLNAAMTHICRV